MTRVRKVTCLPTQLNNLQMTHLELQGVTSGKLENTPQERTEQICTLFGPHQHLRLQKKIIFCAHRIINGGKSNNLVFGWYAGIQAVSV